MAEKKSLVEETLLQMKSLENVISENAKGILQSTMKEEIGELVKESLKEQEAEDDELDIDDTEVDDTETDDTEVDDTEVDDMEFDDTEVDDMEFDDTEVDDMTDVSDEIPGDFSMDEEPIDLTDASDDEILKVFKGMGENDGIIIKKDGNTIDLEDTDSDVEYKIQMGESEDEYSVEEMFYDEKTPYGEDEEFEEMSNDDFSDDIGYEIEMDDEESDQELEESDEELEESDEEMDEIVYEIEMDDEELEESDEELEESDEELEEEMDDTVEEGFKRKGVGFGNPSKFKYKKTTGGFNEKKKQGPKSVGTGSAKKFKYGPGENSGDKLGKNKVVKKTETKEASRTLGTGKYFGKKGLPKPKAAPRHLRVESKDIELNLLREKNEEYRKALNLFRGKLNEVAVFNSNLAYATRLFTEHSTTKQEKINILRRFDSVESLKESKTLYKTIKDELSSQSTKKSVKESIQEQIERSPSSGSAASLIESKTYENPQFMRMKDLMSKMNIKKIN